MSDFEMLSIVLMNLNSIHRSHEKVTAPQPKCAVTFRN